MNPSVQEVVELTRFLRTDPLFDPIRSECERHGISPDASYLAGMIESESEDLTGVIVDSRSRIWYFEAGVGYKVLKWSQVIDVSALDDTFTAIRTAVAMVSGLTQ